jgi:biofilm PGA synthesis N-glycosyltransferase PgaC
MTEAQRASSAPRARLRIVCAVPFLNEEAHLPSFLDSLARQERFPDWLMLVDDGSIDRSARIAARFAAARGNVTLLRRPPRKPSRDRLALATELRSFQSALDGFGEDWELAVKLDADLELCPELFATLERVFLARPELGIAGAHLSVLDGRTGTLVRERCPPHHVRGATKFYRRACLRDISPIPPILGWDTIDEITARAHGWQTESFSCPRGEVIHRRPTGAADGMLRAQYRWGACAYGIGQHPLWVALSAVRRLRERPRVLGSLAFLAGWAAAGIRRNPRAKPSVRAFGRREQLSVLRHHVTRRAVAA